MLLRIHIVTLSIILTSLLLSRYSDSSERLNNEFDEVRQLLQNAREERADVFSAGFFNRALEAFNSAVEDSSKGRNEEGIRRKLSDVRTYLQRALQTATRMKQSFPELVDAYRNADEAGAAELAVEIFRDAMRSFDTVIYRLERGKIESADEPAERTVELFRQAELEAIKEEHLRQVRALLSEAVGAGSPELTPQLFSQAQEILQQAELVLENDRYNHEAAAAQAKMASRILQHALFVTGWITQFRDDPGGWERLILQFEEYIRSLSETVHLNPQFDRNMLISIEAIMTSIRSLEDERDHLKEELENRDLNVGELDAEIQKLRSQSSRYLAELESLRQQILAQERINDRIELVTTLLDSSEGIVIFSTTGGSNQISIRLTWMKFPSGSDEIRTADFVLLDKVKLVIREFPDYSIEVHGHTDSKGRNSDNKKLSYRRAYAVKKYLLTSMNLQEGMIDAIGFGESRSIASNDTAVGRNKNRRIEIVLKQR